MSFGAYGSHPLKDDFNSACDDAYAAGIVLVAASGNSGYDYSAWPASFTNVISVGGHAEDQTLYWTIDYGQTNGGVDIIAPGEKVLTLSLREPGYPNGRLYWLWGTSVSAPHASALIALQLQYARQRNIEPNNAYNWEVMKHSAVQLTGEPYDPVYQGNGKIWAAETNPPPPTPNDGSIDLVAANWPITYNIDYLNPVNDPPINYPLYYIGTDMPYDVTLTNNTDTFGQYTGEVENLKVTTIQAYYQHDNEDTINGNSTKRFFPPALQLDSGYSTILSDTYSIEWDTVPGRARTILDLEFQLTEDPENTRVLKVAYPYAGLFKIKNPNFAGCFLSGTPILMADGTTKSIENLRVGETLLAYDETAGEFKPDAIKHVFVIPGEKEYLIITLGQVYESLSQEPRPVPFHPASRVSTGQLKVTPHHAFYLGGEWVEAGKLKVGDKLLNSENKLEPIASIKHVKETSTVYNLEINPYHTFIAGGVVVHNSRITQHGRLIKAPRL